MRYDGTNIKRCIFDTQIRWQRGVKLRPIYIGRKAFFITKIMIINQKEWSNMCLVIPERYETSLGVIETQQAIKDLKDFFENRLGEMLKLTIKKPQNTIKL